MPIEAVKLNQTNTASADNKINVQPKTNPYPNDSVELSEKKDKVLDKTIKNSLISCGGCLAALTAMGVFFIKHQGNRIKKLYDEKLVIRNLKEKIDFTEAKTVEDGIKFAKEVLGIKEIDTDITLDAINYANKGLVDVSNANKGKVFMPYALRFKAPDKKNEYLAAVEIDINSSEFGNMYINKHFFDINYLDERLEKQLFADKKALFSFSEDLKTINHVPVWDKFIYAIPGKDLIKLIDKYYKDAASLSVEEKRNLFYSLSYGKDNARRLFRNPIDTLKAIEKSEKEYLEKEKVKFDFDDLEKKDYKKQKEFLISILEKLKKQDVYLESKVDLFNPLKTIYHEMGHLQDAAKNLKELDLKQWKFDWKAEWNSIKNKNKNKENTSRIGVKEVDNRWGTIAKTHFEELLNNNPDKFKKYYPDFYDFVNDKVIQQTVGKVSSYAQTGIGEFIADTYAKMIGKQTIPDDVMQLYRKYKGPELP